MEAGRNRLSHLIDDHTDNSSNRFSIATKFNLELPRFGGQVAAR